MLRLVADENFNGHIVAGLLWRRPDLQLVRVQDVGLTGSDDPTLLAWAARSDRIILSHDQATLPAYAYERMAAGEPMAGVIIVPARFRSPRRLTRSWQRTTLPKTLTGKDGAHALRSNEPRRQSAAMEKGRHLLCRKPRST